ncbi:hypothetical protein J6590_087614 [Homalodisca vitripennis]|nr:hypothetical protein J6590_071353 [Homalodisca vitripennis]KAG8295119.1 hypothetical protein J6590_087614 [Homalodisca vitripennis]
MMEKESVKGHAENGLVNRPLRVSIEGNVGCGKSTLINYFKNFPEVDSRPEPLDDWRNVQGHNLLMMAYSEPQRWNFTFQHYIQLSRLNLQTQQTKRRIQIFERSIQNNRACFVEMAYESGMLADPDYVALCEWYDWIVQSLDIGLDLIVYLRSDPKVVFERMQRRGRPEESTVSLEYLTGLHRHYESTKNLEFGHPSCSATVGVGLAHGHPTCQYSPLNKVFNRHSYDIGDRVCGHLTC